ncbi:MAG TPA: ImmA/IrrE family metallo-endopeptidase [Pyrinomonadaceae bacterium]|nr:ImmA/IrrE family metallo-endopeptidase [Pyrinomonadaceae bacterium]
MLSLARKFRRQIKGWNRRPLTEDDFHRLRERYGVALSEEDSEDMIWKGIYTVIDGVPTIIINAKLKGLERLWTLFHELGHHLLHSPATCFFSEDTVRKAQSEANVFAAIALIPEKYVRQMYLWELYDCDEFAAKLFQIRLEVFERYEKKQPLT